MAKQRSSVIQLLVPPIQLRDCNRQVSTHGTCIRRMVKRIVLLLLLRSSIQNAYLLLRITQLVSSWPIRGGLCQVRLLIRISRRSAGRTVTLVRQLLPRTAITMRTPLRLVTTTRKMVRMLRTYMLPQQPISRISHRLQWISQLMIPFRWTSGCARVHMAWQVTLQDHGKSLPNIP